MSRLTPPSSYAAGADRRDELDPRSQSASQTASTPKTGAPAPRSSEPGTEPTEFSSGYSNGRGVDVRRYLHAQREGQIPSTPAMLMRPEVRRDRAQPPRSVLRFTKAELAKQGPLPRPTELRQTMDHIIWTLRQDGTWPTPETWKTAADVNTQFPRPSFQGEGRKATTILPVAEVENWAERSELAQFYGAMVEFARAIHSRYPPGHPARGAALVAGYEAFSQTFFAHAGRKVPYQRMGTERGDMGPDWADLFSLPYRPSDSVDFRSAIDCDGFIKLALEFFEAAAMETYSNTSFAPDGTHKQGIAVDRAVVLGFSNQEARELPSPESRQVGVTLRDWVREQVRRPSLLLSPRVFDEKALELRSRARKRGQR